MKPQRKQELKHDEFVDTIAWLWEGAKLYQQEILIGIVVALVLVGGGLYVVNRMQRARDTAWFKLAVIDDSVSPRRFMFEAKSPEITSGAIKDYEQLASDYPRSGTAPLALLRAARMLQEANKLDEALGVLDRLISGYPKSALSSAAQEAKACVLEDKRQFAEALALHEKIAESGPKYLSAGCYVNAARCAELTKDAARAKGLYQKAIAAAPDSLTAQFAEERLKNLGQAKSASPEAAGPKKQG